MAKQTANPFDLDEAQVSLAERMGREKSAKDALDGRLRVRRRRPIQISLKTTAERKAQMLRLGEWANMSITEVIEAGLDALERELKKKSKKPIA